MRDLENDRELECTKYKLGLLEEHMAKARERPDTPLNRESFRSLARMAKQMREEVIRYEMRRKRTPQSQSSGSLENAAT